MAENTKKEKTIVRLSTRKHIEMKDLTLDSMIAYVNYATKKIAKEDKEKANNISKKFKEVFDSAYNEKRIIVGPVRIAFIEMFPEINEKMEQKEPKEPKVKKTALDKYKDKIKEY